VSPCRVATRSGVGAWFGVVLSEQSARQGLTGAPSLCLLLQADRSALFGQLASAQARCADLDARASALEVRLAAARADLRATDAAGARTAAAVRGSLEVLADRTRTLEGALAAATARAALAEERADAVEARAVADGEAAAAAVKVSRAAEGQYAVRMGGIVRR